MAQESRQQGGEHSDSGSREQRESHEFPDIGGWGVLRPGWFQRNFRNVVLPIIILIIVVGGLYLYNRPQKRGESATPKETAENILPGEQKSPLGGGEESEATSAGAESQTVKGGVLGGHEKTAPKLAGDVYRINAANGDGITHLARRTLKQYLEKEAPDVNLSPEQKIYAEDFIQNRTGTRLLDIGEEITFSKDLVREAVEASQKLTDAQIKNLSKYVPLVPSL